jgi:hypothetical protein
VCDNGTCKDSCTDTCSSKGYKTSEPAGQTCSTTTVCGKTCYHDCKDTCSYTITAASCASECKNVGSVSCTKNGTTYYSSCGSSKCKSGQPCNNGTCKKECTYCYSMNGWPNGSCRMAPSTSTSCSGSRGLCSQTKDCYDDSVFGCCSVAYCCGTQNIN